MANLTDEQIVAQIFDGREAIEAVEQGVFKIWLDHLFKRGVVDIKLFQVGNLGFVTSYIFHVTFEKVMTEHRNRILKMEMNRDIVGFGDHDPGIAQVDGWGSQVVIFNICIVHWGGNPDEQELKL